MRFEKAQPVHSRICDGKHIYNHAVPAGGARLPRRRVRSGQHGRAHEHLQPDKATQDYFAALAEAGVQTALVSNNRRERIELFNERLGVFIVADAQTEYTAPI